ncbi:MAG TPA: hypothetical protein VF666_05060 [Pyrinomonadaceae bacterium]
MIFRCAALCPSKVRERACFGIGGRANEVAASFFEFQYFESSSFTNYPITKVSSHKSAMRRTFPAIDRL